MSNSRPQKPLFDDENDAKVEKLMYSTESVSLLQFNEMNKLSTLSIFIQFKRMILMK